MRNRKKLVIFLLFTSLVIACNPVIHKAQDIIQLASDVQTEQQEQTPAIPPQIRELLAYVPPEWVDQHPPEILGPIVYYLDFDTMSRDLGLPDVTSADDRKNKLPLITGVITQGLPFTTNTIDPMSADCFENWGWDIADVSQAIYFPGKSISILTGSFSIETVTNALTARGYTSMSTGEYTLFVGPDEIQGFAVSEGILIIAPSRDELEAAIQQKASTAANAGDLSQLRQLLSLTQSPYGFVLVASGSEIAVNEQIGILPQEVADDFDSCPYQSDWEFLVITFHPEEKIFHLNIVYSFPSHQDAKTYLPLIEKMLTMIPSYRNLSLTWADLIAIDSIKNEANLVIVEANTDGKNFLRSTFEQRDYYGLLAIKPVDPNCP